MDNNEKKTGIKNKLSGLGQEVLGDIEIVGGVLTADPNTRAEGEFNAQVGKIREDLEDDADLGEEKEPAS